MITGGGIYDEKSLNIYTDGSSFPGKKRAAGVGVVLMWVDESGNPQTSEHVPTGFQSATIDEMEIYACTVGLQEATRLFLRVDVRWVKRHKSNFYNRAADKLAKRSAATPFNAPLSISQTTSKWSDRKTVRGCVTFNGRLVSIRIISTEYKKYAREYEYRFEAIDPADPSYKDVDFVRYKHLLSRNKCLLVRLNSDQDRPRIDEVLEELNPDNFRY